MVDRHTNKIGLVVLALSFFWTGTTFAQAAIATTPDGPYTLFLGNIGSSSATIMIDQATGSTWFLGQQTKDGKTWIATPLNRQDDVTTTGWIPLPLIQNGKSTSSAK